MEQSVSETKILSYSHLKEVAKEKMSIVRLFVNCNEVWLPVCQGRIKLFQIDPDDTLRQIHKVKHLKDAVDGLYILLETDELVQSSAEEETYSFFRKMIMCREFNTPSIIFFYDISKSLKLDYDLTSKIIRAHFPVEALQRVQHSICYKLYV